MRPDLIIAGQLQREKEIFLARNLGQNLHRMPGTATSTREFTEPAQAFADNPSLAMGPVKWKAKTPGHDMVVVPVGIARATPETRSNRRQRWYWRQLGCGLPDGFAVSRQGRMAVPPVAFQ